MKFFVYTTFLLLLIPAFAQQCKDVAGELQVFRFQYGSGMKAAGSDDRIVAQISSPVSFGNVSAYFHVSPLFTEQTSCENGSVVAHFFYDVSAFQSLRSVYDRQSHAIGLNVCINFDAANNVLGYYPALFAITSGSEPSWNC
eukprot:TRINITY_DN1723_c0_g1_i1.p1 TRINITY_DN1723_c0_g1~~TRINITY_DN1723_c0_g1_i1.p1  ORF type:complete len:142 (-),score=26.19 TRINITY_DN1723_c0_g1_i1:235-660(-)